MTLDCSQDITTSHRQDDTSIRNLYRQVQHLPHVKEVCDVLPHGVMILSRERQIIFSNRKLIDLTGLLTVDECLGLRPGELFHCINSDRSPAGCGGSAQCRVCGALLAMLESQLRRESTTRELRLTARINGDMVAHDFKILAAPFSHERHQLTIVHLIDISDEKRRRALERIFFHDLLNTAGSLYNMSQLITHTGQRKNNQYAKLLHMASKQLVQEIKAQRELMEAENGELKVNYTAVHSLDCLNQVIDLFQEYQNAHHNAIQLSPESHGIIHRSDHALLLRVLSNLVKNALEASVSGQTVTVGCRRINEKIAYWVRNPEVMAPETQLQIFQRSFSTKGADRGLGTYSIRLLTEKFLKGTVSFDSSADQGTRFTVTYPIEPD